MHFLFLIFSLSSLSMWDFCLVSISLLLEIHSTYFTLLVINVSSLTIPYFSSLEREMLLLSLFILQIFFRSPLCQLPNPQFAGNLRKAIFLFTAFSVLFFLNSKYSWYCLHNNDDRYIAFTNYPSFGGLNVSYLHKFINSLSFLTRRWISVVFFSPWEKGKGVEKAKDWGLLWI